MRHLRIARPGGSVARVIPSGSRRVRRGRSRWLLLAAALVLPGCSTPTPPPDTYPPDPDARTHWELSHRVRDTRGMTVVEQSMTDGEEYSGVRLVDAATRQTDDCFVSLSVPGTGGPGNRIGEKVTTTYDGHPAVRSGAGAEADYLMWQLADGSWVEVHCSSEGVREAVERVAVERVAAAVDLSPGPIRLPVDLEVPPGLRPTMISADLTSPGARVYLSASRAATPRWDLLIMVGVPELSPPPTGEAMTLNGRPAMVDDSETHPVVWVQEQGQWIYVGTATSDTGPYPDRRGELPTITALAESLTFAQDLTDPATWFSADKIFG